MVSMSLVDLVVPVGGKVERLARLESAAQGASAGQRRVAAEVGRREVGGRGEDNPRLCKVWHLL